MSNDRDASRRAKRRRKKNPAEKHSNHACRPTKPNRGHQKDERDERTDPRRDAEVLDDSDDSVGDEELLRRIAQGREAFELLDRRWRERFNRLASRHLRDVSLRDDGVQDALQQVAKKAGHFTPGRKAKPWIYAVARNAIIDTGKRESKHHKKRSESDVKDMQDNSPANDDDRKPNDDDKAIGQANAQRVVAALGEMRDEYQLLFYLVRFSAARYEDLAVLFDKVAVSLAGRVRRVKLSLNDVLQQVVDETEVQVDSLALKSELLKKWNRLIRREVPRRIRKAAKSHGMDGFFMEVRRNLTADGSAASSAQDLPHGDRHE